MSKSYRVLTNQENPTVQTPEMRLHSQRPGKFDADGIVYVTEQSHKDQTNINNIIKKYHKTQTIDHISKIEGTYGDLTASDYQSMQNSVINAKLLFDELPSNIRNRFRNSPADLLGFMEDPNNRSEAIELGLINQDWTPETDGLGEHVPEGDNILKPEAVPPAPPKP